MDAVGKTQGQKQRRICANQARFVASINNNTDIDGLLDMSFLGDFRFETDRTNIRFILRPPQMREN
jgi:hypothetical protein